MESKTWIDNICSERVTQSVHSNTIKYTILDALGRYPYLQLLLVKVDVGAILGENSDALARSVWVREGTKYRLEYTIVLNQDFISKDTLPAADIKGILWHEIGHILSAYFYHADTGFEVMNQAVYMKLRGKVCCNLWGNETTYRVRYGNRFWRKLKSSFAIDDLKCIYENLRMYLTANNGNELLAECFKYSYAGRERFRGNADALSLIDMVDEVVREFERSVLYFL